MATTKPKLNDEFNVGTVDKVSTVDKIPDEFSIPDGDGTGLSTDSLNDVTFNDKQYEDDYKKLNPPTGDWFKEDRWDTFKAIVNRDDNAVGDINTDGRTYFSISGRPEARLAEGVEHHPMLFIRSSPDKRYKQDKPTEFDSAYKLFMRLREVYLSVHGERMKTPAQLKYMLEEDSYVLRTMNGDNGPIVVDVKVKRVQR